jgi:hypothetical protein
MTEPRPEWTIERGDGWTSMERTRPHVRVLTDSKAVHAHYWHDDDEMDAQGWGMADLVCHGCGRATRFIYPAGDQATAETEPFRPMRDAFVHDHRNHTMIGHGVLCPPAYSITETRDLREPVSA